MKPACEISGSVETTVQVVLSGHVQGVGFRPFVYRIAKQHGLVGEVQNRLGEVRVVAHGDKESIDAFCD
ncbi:MAG: acylphosphatase, partial [Woeseiaceae bacterium]|nr:acylphosphatase [Woeseiaceae bacterium]